ncbi:MAG: nicotinate (nicotinamide) nucleotide adenylyltransferase [Flavobacteriales bacterium]|nr:nicotinate (nicotinamide) nucleotide adenylyltransferase [Flavobacteriales bacterium]
MNIGLLFGSFNPIHKGHISVAEYFMKQDCIDEVWLVVTPANPFKDMSQTVSGDQRLEMCRLACNNTSISICDIEFGLPKPNYTYSTLQLLRDLHRDKKFSLIVGDDNIDTLNLWKNYKDIILNHEILVYPRDIKKEVEVNGAYQFFNEAPLIPWSSTSIREQIAEKGNITEMVPDSVMNYIQKNRLY